MHDDLHRTGTAVPWPSGPVPWGGAPGAGAAGR